MSNDMQKKEQAPKVVWFTGLPCSGKTTLASALEQRLHQQGLRTCVLDGDILRNGLCTDLGFSKQDRDESIRRAAEAAKLLLAAGSTVIVAIIAPLEEQRARVRRIIGSQNLLEVFCRCPLEVCEQRDVKGMYKKARSGIIQEFTGISSPYEIPSAPDVIADTSAWDIAHCLNSVESALAAKNAPHALADIES
jgi:adenylylsulfate kinase